MCSISDVEQPEDDFDKDITSEPDEDVDFVLDAAMMMQLAFAELHELFVALRKVGFSENQAIKFLAFTSLFEQEQ